jgi:large repetitive protein
MKLRAFVLAILIAAAAVSLQAQADFTVAKSGPAITPPDNQVEFTITVTNNGPNAGPVTVTDPVPAGLTFVSVAPPAGFICTDPGAGATSGTVTCNAVTMAPGSAVIPITFYVPATTPSQTTLTNTVTVSSPIDVDGTNNSASASTTTPAVSDLTVSKTGPTTANADTDVSFNISVTNLGPDDAEEVQLSDVVIGGWSFVSVTAAPGFNCADPGPGATSGMVVCSAQTMAAGSTANFTIVFHIPADAPAGTTFTNVANVDSPTDPNDENNSSSASTQTPPPPSGDVAIFKTGPASAPADSDVTYTITVTNFGPDAAGNVSFTDTLPASTGMPPPQMTFVSFNQTSGPAFNCGTPDVTTTCTIAALPANTTATFTFTGHIPSGTETGSVFSNTVSMTSTNDPNEENNASATALVVSSADVSINKAAPGTAVAGGPTIDYVITVSNAGPDEAVDVSFSDPLPAGVTFVGIVQNNGPLASCAGGSSVACTLLSPLPAMSSAQFTITVQPNASVPNGTVLTNTAMATSSTAETNPNNNSSTAMTTVSAQADVSIAKSAPLTAVAGNNITYGITVANAGPSNASSVSWTDILPANTTFVSAMQTTGPTFSCTTGSTVSCSIAMLAAGAGATFNIVVQVSPSTPPASTIDNTATVASSTTDTNGNNNTSTASTTISAQADVSITKTAPTAAGAGTNLTYTISVANGGPSNAANVSWTDVLPPETTFVSATQNTGPAFGCTTGATITCSIATLASGATATFTVIVQVAPATPLGTQITNAATVSSQTPDANTANNTSAAMTTVTTSADLAVTKTGPAATPSNTTVTYAVGVSNAGPAAAANVTLTDNVPANMTFAGFSQPTGPAFNCTTPPAGGTGAITCTIASLANGAGASFEFAFNVLPGAASGSTSTNTATVGAATADPNPGNNSASVITTIGVSIPAISPLFLALLAVALTLVALRRTG